MGKVYLIGAGPGAADLITVRGARLLATADVVLHDALVEPEMLALAPQARLIAVGKRCGAHSSAQHFINKQLVDAARAASLVVRLKGGDPMLFGRADEEMRALEAAAIDYEVVPGITAALAGAAALKRSLTLRGVARSVALVTHKQAPGTEAVGVAASADSLVYYMGRDGAVGIASSLLAQGRSADTAVAVVEACSTPRQRILALTLGEVAAGRALDWMDRSQASMLMIGDAFAASDRLAAGVQALQPARPSARARGNGA